MIQTFGVALVIGGAAGMLLGWAGTPVWAIFVAAVPLGLAIALGEDR